MTSQNDIKFQELKHGLYLVSSPIGNLADITLRAIHVLKNSDYILCEDTRVSKKLFDKYSIKPKVFSYHKFNEKKNLQKVIDLLLSKKRISLISDAGTPTISDPGKILVQECIKNNVEVFPVPGASAVTSAVSISGFTDKYHFYGFFPEKQKEIREELAKLSTINSSIIFFISSKKIEKAIKPLQTFFNDREIVICKEITKFYEEFLRTRVSKLQSVVKNLKGELTIVISEKINNKNISNKLSESDKKYIKKMTKNLSVKDIVDLMSFSRKISKKEVYQYCLRIKNEK